MTLGAAVVLLAAAQTPVTRYLIVSGDSSSGSWDSRDEPRFAEWRSKYGAHFAWFRQDGRDYIVTDSRTLAQFEEAMAPQREVNRQQAEVNRHQAGVNLLQQGVNSHQAEVNRQQSLVNQGGGEQSRVNQLQSEVNSKQHAVNAAQDKVNQKQAVVNREQDEVNQMQKRASAEIEKALAAIFDSARRQGLAHEAR
jgi:hypothetical protein